MSKATARERLQVPRILILWSAPRCRSTAFLRMMKERGDFTVLHEPFSHVVDFGEATLLDRVVRSERELIDTLRELAEREALFLKDTTDFHYPGLLADNQFLRAATHSFMIRHPREAIASHHRLNPRLGRDEIGFARLCEIFEAVIAVSGRVPPVIDGDDLVSNPESVVRSYCREVQIPFLPDALSWRAALLPEWRRTARWHTAAAESSGFERRECSGDTDIENHPVLGEYLRYHLPYYRKMHERRIPA